MKRKTALLLIVLPALVAYAGDEVAGKGKKKPPTPATARSRTTSPSDTVTSATCSRGVSRSHSSAPGTASTHSCSRAAGRQGTGSG